MPAGLVPPRHPSWRWIDRETLELNKNYLRLQLYLIMMLERVNPPSGLIQYVSERDRVVWSRRQERNN